MSYSGQVCAGNQQTIEHPGLAFVSPRSPGTHLHPANHLLGAVVGPRDAWIVEKGGVPIPILTDPGQ
jgi:hypothetical protein